MALLAGGASNAKIAQTLFVTPNTVRTHLDRIRDKTGARNRAELTRYAMQAGIEPVVPPLDVRPAHTRRVWWVARPLPPGAGRTLRSAYENQIQQGTDLYQGNYRLGGIRDRVSGVDLQPPVVQRHRRGTQLGRRVHRTSELPAHGFRLAGADLPGRRRGAARPQAQGLHPGAAAGAGAASAPGAARPRSQCRHRCPGGLRASAPSAAPGSSRETGSARDAESQWGPCNPGRNTSRYHLR